jgi:flavin-dependent dehydrogenase
MYVADWGYLGLNPLPAGRVNAIAVMEPSLLKERLSGKGSAGLVSCIEDHVFGQFASSALKDRVRGAEIISDRVWTAAPIAWMPKKIIHDACALVGDSAGFIDPFTGEGIYHALASAWELSELIANHGVPLGLMEYEKWHKQTFGPEETFCLWLQKLLPYSRIADYVLRQLETKSHLKQILAETVADRLPTTRVLSPLFWGRVLWPT